MEQLYGLGRSLVSKVIPYRPPQQTGNFYFERIHLSKKVGSKARVGKITTPHGSFLTPAFVPVGTNAALKGISNSTMSDIFETQGTKTLTFCNTYHLMLHPGTKIVKEGMII